MNNKQMRVVISSVLLVWVFSLLSCINLYDPAAFSAGDMCIYEGYQESTPIGNKCFSCVVLSTTIEMIDCVDKVCVLDAYERGMITDTDCNVCQNSNKSTYYVNTGELCQ